MSVTIKTEEEIALMREAGRILALVHQNLAKEIKAGMSTWDVDQLCEELIHSYGCESNFKGLYDYPATVCVSVNEEVVHGIPKKDHILYDGDIVSLDTGVIYKGYHSDAARTIAIGETTPEAELLIERTRECFFEGIKKAKAGNHLHQISRAIGECAEKYGYGVIRELTGHGIGTSLHEDPMIPNYRKILPGIKLKPGMTLAIEPMISMGNRDIFWEEDLWTVVTCDYSLAAHYENTILITDGEPEIFTLTEDEKKEMAAKN